MEKAKPIAKKWIFISAAVAIAVYGLIGFLISPVKAYLSSDAVYSETVIPTMLDYLSDILEIGVVSLFYAVIIAFLYRHNGGMFAVFGTFAFVTLYKCFINTAMTWINIGGVSSEWFWDLADVIYYTMFEIAQMTVIYLLAKRFIGEFYLLREAKLKFAKDDDGTGVSLQEPYPYQRLFSIKNCLLKSVLACAVVTFVFMVSISILSDSLTILIGGLPQQPQTWLLMAINYVSMILWGVLVYFFTLGATAVILNKKKS